MKNYFIHKFCIFILLAVAISIFANSSFADGNMNCSFYPIASIPGDMVKVLSLAKSNNSHVQLPNMTDYAWSIACKSNITSMDSGCTGANTIEIAQLLKTNNSHVSIDGVYSNSVCINSTNISVYFQTLQSAGGATPAGYECLFSLANESNSQVFDCDYPGASINWNIRVTTGLSPTGSITIFGENGTDITNSRNVMLNLSYDDNLGVAACKFANDNLTNLAAASWENCTAVKSWILSEGEGNKTVYYSIKDEEDIEVTYNDSIVYHFFQDYTAPYGLFVYDSNYGYDVDWWNDNTSLSAYWWNAVDDIGTIYYKYRIFADGVCLNNDCNWTDTNLDIDVNVSGLSLNESSNYSFEILYYTSDLINNTATSDGTFIDVTKPSTPIINSSSHPIQSSTYGSNNVSLNFSSTDSGSGIAGYSYVIDNAPGTGPDNFLEVQGKEILQSSTNNGFSQLLRANSSFGSPHTYAVFTQISTNISINDSFEIQAAIAEAYSDYDDEVILEAYLMSIGEGVDPSLFDYHANAVSNVYNISKDVEYAAIYSDSTFTTFYLTVNTTVLDTANDIYLVIAGNTGDNDNLNNVSIFGSTSGFDSSTKNFVCDNTNVCVENTTDLDYAINIKRQKSVNSWNAYYYDLLDGVYYFHVKAKDNAGNWGNSSHYKINITSVAATPRITTPFSGQIFSANPISVDVEVDKLANVSVTVLHEDGTNSSAPSQLFSSSANFTVYLKNGSNTIYATAINPNNGITKSSSNVFVRFANSLPSGNNTLRISYSGSACAGHLCTANEVGVTVGIAIENDTASLGATSIESNTAIHTFKIFATKPIVDTTTIESNLDNDDFLDKKVPMFGYDKGVPYHIVRTEMRPNNIYFEGDRVVDSGTYTLVFKNQGTTPDGRTNITVKII